MIPYDENFNFCRHYVHVKLWTVKPSLVLLTVCTTYAKLTSVLLCQGQFAHKKVILVSAKFTWQDTVKYREVQEGLIFMGCLHHTGSLNQKLMHFFYSVPPSLLILTSVLNKVYETCTFCRSWQPSWMYTTFSESKTLLSGNTMTFWLRNSHHTFIILSCCNLLFKSVLLIEWPDQAGANALAFVYALLSSKGDQNYSINIV